MSEISEHLVLHGSIILLVGLLSGAPMGRAINRGDSDDEVRAWRVAHSGLSMGAVLLFSVSLVLPHLVLSPGLSLVLGAAFIVSGYGFALALPLGAFVGERGLQPTRGVGTIVYLGNLIGAGGSLVGALILLWGAASALST